MSNSNPTIMNAATFQQPLAELATTLSLKVQREGFRLIPTPVFLCVDVYVLLKQSRHTYDLFFYINADEKRHKEAGWKVAYGAVMLPLIRCMIDCLYTITALLDRPARAYDYRKSGYRRTLEALAADEEHYGGTPEWDEYIASQRAMCHQGILRDGLTLQEVLDAKYWPTLGKYLTPKKNTSLTAHQRFLKELTLGFWRQYSSMAHGEFDGLLPTAMFYTPTDIPHDDRPRIDSAYERMIFWHISRVAGILLCMLTEVQAHFGFDGANINKRLHKVWDALCVAPEVKELYDGRYKKLMQEKGISPE